MKHTKKFSFLCGIIAFLSFASVQSVQAQDEFNITDTWLSQCIFIEPIEINYQENHEITPK